MPPHQRSGPVQGQGSQGDVPRPTGPQNIFSRINEDTKALNTSIQLITQKLNSMVRYEKILGRNLVVLNRKIKELQELRQGAPADSSVEVELAEISKRLSENAEAIARLQSDVDYIKQNYAKSEEVSEMKYVIDSINPMEFVTVKDVQELVSSSAGKKKKDE